MSGVSGVARGGFGASLFTFYFSLSTINNAYDVSLILALSGIYQELGSWVVGLAQLSHPFGRAPLFTKAW